MNTQLLTTNNTCGTNKGLKTIAAVICMTAVFVFTNSVVFAQSFTNTQNQTSEERKASKEAWVKEHQEELNKTNAPVVVKQQPVETKAALVPEKKSEKIVYMPAPKAVNVTPAPSKKIEYSGSVEGELESPSSLVTIPVNGKIMTIEEANKVKQTSANSTPQTVKPLEAKKVAQPKEVKVQDPSNLPYYNYKGIANLEDAKKLWVAENPEAYKRMQSNTGVSQQNYPAVKANTASSASPNANRRLPANYDDSKLGNPQTK